jgi:hypothetical protein
MEKVREYGISPALMKTANETSFGVNYLLSIVGFLWILLANKRGKMLSPVYYLAAMIYNDFFRHSANGATNRIQPIHPLKKVFF